jgi:L-rhamnono-1,4-lactonase
MTPGNFLAKRHGIADYLAVANPKPEGFVYVETDRYLPSSAPDLPKDNDWEYRRIIELWAKEPLEEIRFLRRIVEGKTEEGDGVKGDHGSLMKGVVLYAPFHFNGLHLRAYMDMAEEVAGPKLWSRVVGFRYLLQGKGDGVVERMLAGDRPNSKSVRWMSNFRHLKKGNEGKGRCFDVGVDTHRDGMGPFEALAEFMHEMRYWEKTSEIEGTPVTFILSKPRGDFERRCRD